MKNLCSLFLVAIMLASTCPLLSQESVFSFPFENEYRLPPMKTRLNKKEISTTYQSYGSFYTTEYTWFRKDTMEQTSYSYYSSSKVMDAAHFLEFYMEEQLLEPGEDKTGLVEMSIIYFNEYDRINAGIAPAILTLGISALAGLTVSTKVTEVEIIASFFDNANQLLAEHRGVGKGKKTVSLYRTSSREPNQKAIVKAIEDLNTKVFADPRLVERH